MPKIDAASWNAALDAVAELLGSGYTWVKRPFDQKTMTFPIEIKCGDAKIRGAYIDATHCTPDEDAMDIAAVLSLKRKV